MDIALKLNIPATHIASHGQVHLLTWNSYYFTVLAIQMVMLVQLPRLSTNLFLTESVS